MINVDVKVKKDHVCEKDYFWNPATCNYENGKSLASIIDDSAIASKTLVLTNRKFDHDAKPYINTNQFRELIPIIYSNLVKFLGHAISFDLTDKDQIEIINSASLTLLSLTDKSKHRGVHKIWILQHVLLPHL